MRYMQIGTGSNYPYPNFEVDPREKETMEWCRAYAKAAYYDFSFVYPKGVFANNGGDYQKFKTYALGKQPISNYRSILGIDQQTNNTWLSIDWSVRSIVSTYRDRAISRLMEQMNGIVATPIDILAKAEMDDFYAETKAKLTVRDLIQQANSELGGHPLITLQTGEPMDIEELEMRMEQGEQFNRAKDAELAIELGMYENNYKQWRRTVYEDLFDLGVAGYKEWLGTDNKAKFRKVNPENVIVSYCRKSDFSDAVHAGEIIDVPLVELATVTDKEGNKMFNEEQLQEFASSIAGRWGNPSLVSIGTGWFKPYDKFKCKVLDIEFFTYNDYVYRDGVDENGNSDYRKADFKRGKKSNKYTRKRIQCVYKCKWIIGTEYCYDFGMAEDQKRSPNIKKKATTSLSYKFYAYNFYEMKAQGFMERLIPYLDDYQLTIYKIQNFKNRSVPSGWWIDLDGLEAAALNKGGANMTPQELLQMFFETGLLVGRSKDSAGVPMGQNWKPVIPIENSIMTELVGFFQDLQNTVMAIERLTGYNDITAGEGSPRTLVPGYEIADMSTSHALYPMKFAEENLSERLAADVLCRMQQGVKKGSVSGYAPYSGALNRNTLQFIEVSPSIATREYGIMLQEKTSDEKKQWVLQQLQQDIANGLLDTSDAIMILNTHNAKQAQQILAYRVKKNKETQQKNQMQLVQQQTQGNQQIAQDAALLKQQEIQLQGEIDLQKEQMRIEGEIAKKELELQYMLQMKQLELGVKDKMNTDLVDSKKYAADVTAEAKVISSGIDHDAKLLSAQLSGEHSQEKQKLANEKTTSTSKK